MAPPRRLNPQDTLHGAGVRPGAVLRVHPERTAGAVNPLRREEALARVRAQVEDYAAAHPGFAFTANSPVAPTEYVFSFDAAGFARSGATGLPRRTDHHHVLVYLPPDFPDRAPEAWWQTDIFHPNIDTKLGWVCLGALQQFYKPSLDFNDLCGMLVDIAAYRIYSVEPGNYLNGEASRWALSAEGQTAIAAAGGLAVEQRVVPLAAPGRALRLRKLQP